MKCRWRIGVAVSCLVALGLLVGCQSEQSPSKSSAAKGDRGAKKTTTEVAKAKEQPAEETKKDTGGETAPAKAAASEPKVPFGLPALEVPADNPITPEKVELGKMLYFDTRLSKNGKVSCATCHDPKLAWAEREATSTGIDDQVGGRNSPTVINAAYATAQFWDGRAKSLEEQALGPIENPIEMGHKLPDMIQDLSKIQAYKDQFKKVFGTEVTAEGMAKAIASFERTVLSGNSPYDRFVKGDDEKALDEQQQRGKKLFEEKGCATCHLPPLFSSYQYYNAGVGMDKKEPDPGRKAVTKEDKDMGKFRVPALREVANTAPYFHDGSVAKLEEAVALMAAGGKENANLSPIFKSVKAAKITDEEQKDIVAFLKAISGEYPVIEPPKLP